MNLDDAKALWTSDHEPTDETMSTRTLSDSEILRLVQEQSEAFDQKIRRRDLLESIAAVAVCLFFGWLAWDDPSPLVTAGSLIIVGGSALIFGRLRWARARFANAPLLIGLLLVTVGDNGWSAFTFVYGTVVLLGAGWIYVLNQRAVRRSLRPRRAELTHLLDQVEEGNET